MTYPRPNSGNGGTGSESISSGVASEAGGNKSLAPLKGDEVVPVLGAPGLSCGMQRCVIKTCNGLECTLFGFERGNGTPLGTFDNNDSIIEQIAEDFRNAEPVLDKQR